MRKKIEEKTKSNAANNTSILAIKDQLKSSNHDAIERVKKLIKEALKID